MWCRRWSGRDPTLSGRSGKISHSSPAPPLRSQPRPKTCLVKCPCALLFCAALVAGCQKGPAQVAPAEPPVVPVSHPVAREVTDYVDFTGRTDAVEAVNVVPRVTGYLMKIPFREGSEVKAGDL